MIADAASDRRSKRYLLDEEIAAGGMATVHVGRRVGDAGVTRLVAIKRLHPQFAKDPDLVSMLLDEARVLSRIRHPNVAALLDTVSSDGELLLVMEYVHGVPLTTLMRALRARGEAVPPDIAVAIAVGILQGLAAAHAAVDERRHALGVVHRDVSPQNVLVGADGVVRLVDFGIAKAAGRIQTTRHGQVKGKVAYMSPEQLRGEEVDARTDVYACGVVLWEALTGRRLFAPDSPEATMLFVLEAPVEPPSAVRPTVPCALDAVVLRAVARDRSERFACAADMEAALEEAVVPATVRQVRAWVEANAGERLREEAERIARVEARAAAHALGGSPVAEGAVVVADAAEPPDPPATRATPSAGVRARRVVRGVALAGALALASAVGFVVWRSADPGTAGRTSPTTASASAPASVSAAPSTTASAGVASAQIEQDAAPPATSRSRRASGRPAPRAGCNPPYTIDKAGIRRPIASCL